MHDSAGLDAVIRAASTPGSPQFGHYLTPAQYTAEYAPTAAEVAAVRSWLTAPACVTGVSPDNLIVSAQATTATAERAFGVTVNDYRSGSRTFFSNDVAPSVPAGLNVHWISGLNDSVVPKSFAQVAPAFRSERRLPAERLPAGLQRQRRAAQARCTAPTTSRSASPSGASRSSRVTSRSSRPTRRSQLLTVTPTTHPRPTRSSSSRARRRRAPARRPTRTPTRGTRPRSTSSRRTASRPAATSSTGSEACRS